MTINYNAIEKTYFGFVAVNALIGVMDNQLKTIDKNSKNYDYATEDYAEIAYKLNKLIDDHGLRVFLVP